MEKKSFSVTIEAEMKKLSEVGIPIHDFLAANGIAHETAYKLELAVEEMVSNVIKYGYDQPSSADTVDISLTIEGGQVTLVLEDGGREFDPLQVEPPDTGKELGKRQVGGVGIHLTRSMTDSMVYRRDRSRNRNIIEIKVNC